MFWELDSTYSDVPDETVEMIVDGHWVLYLVISHTRQGVPFATGIRDTGIWVLCLVIGLRVVTASGLCVLRCRTRDRGYDLFRALCSVSL